MPTASGCPDTYDRLGIQEVINAQSWATGLGISLMHAEVSAAMEEAGSRSVDQVLPANSVTQFTRKGTYQ